MMVLESALSVPTAGTKLEAAGRAVAKTASTVILNIANFFQSTPFPPFALNHKYR